MSDMAAKRNAYRVLVGKTEGEGSLGRLMTGWEDNIKMGLEEIQWEDRDCNEPSGFIKCEKFRTT